MPHSSFNNMLKKWLFIEQLSDDLQIGATLPGRLILNGVFNVHWDCDNDSECVDLANLEYFDLVQHVKGPTHEHSHALELVITHKEDDLVTFITDLHSVTHGSRRPPAFFAGGGNWIENSGRSRMGHWADSDGPPVGHLPISENGWRPDDLQANFNSQVKIH